MKPKPASSPQVRIGTFELDLQAGEIHTNGLKIRLQDQPLEILAMLVDRPGEVLSREELRLKLWPADTFVDFEHGLNRAINKLREAFGDDAAKPRYIETLPRRGYRLIARVEVMPNGEKAQNGAGNASSLPESGASPDAKEDQREVRGGAVREPPPRKRWIWTSLVAAWWPVCVLVILVCAVLGYWIAQPPPAPRVTQIVRLTHDRLSKGQILATDGTRVYFSEQSASGTWTPAMVSVKGGETTAIRTSLEQPEVMDVSADGSELLVKDSQGSLWALPSVGGSPRQLGNLVAQEAAWSPDGQKILFIHNNELLVAQGDGTEARKILTVPGDPYFIRWSPDGRRITVSIADGKVNMVWEAMADGTDLHPVLPNWHFPLSSCSGHWTPDGKYLLFDSFRDGPDEIWVVRERAGFFGKRMGTPVRLTQGPANFGRPTPSKDGKKIFAFAWEDEAELMRYDAHIKQYLSYLPGLQAREVDFTHDGNWVAYRGPDNSLWRARVDGTEPLQLTFPPMQVSAPRWSPDGGRIAFQGHVPGGGWSIYLVSAHGGAPEKATPSDFRSFDPTWSPDGRKLAFYGFSTMTDDALCILDAQTKQLSKAPGDMFLSPRWSPDGRYIAATGGDPQRLSIFDLATQQWNNLAEVPAENPSWSRDGKYVYFNLGGPQPAVLRVGISDRKLERVAELKSLLPNHINWFGLGPDDSLLVLRGSGGADIYALDWEAP